MTTNNQTETSTVRSNEYTEEVWRGIMQRLSSAAPLTYRDEYRQVWDGSNTVATQPRVADRTNTSRGYTYNWVAFDDMTDPDTIAASKLYIDDAMRQVIMQGTEQYKAELNHTRVTEAEMKMRGTGINVRSLPQAAIDVIVMPHRDSTRKERLYLQIIQDLNEQLQSLKTVNKCAVENVEL